MKKMLYVMNVDWNWIKQRPHFLAEGLASKYELTIVYQYRYGRKRLQKRSNEGLNIKPIYVIPKISGVRKLKWINDKILAYKVKKIVNKNEPDIVFLTYPTHIDLIPDNYKGKIVYDCMDNHSEFCDGFSEKKSLEKKEQLLVKKANIIMTSSLYLQNRIMNKYNIKRENTVLIRNAFDGEIMPYSTNDEKKTEFFKMAYIGTISKWFDWKTIENIMNKRNDVKLHLYGPLDTEIPMSNSNIVYHGTIEHSELYGAIKDMDCLIMPFVINDLIEAVDPVKIYEYINFNKNIIMSKYKEVERFKKFVYFYSNPQEFEAAIANIRKIKSVKYSQQDRIDFLKANTWKSRVDTILGLLKGED